MTTQRVTIDLPDAVFRQLVRIADVTNQPIEALVAQSVIGNLPPSVDNAAPELQSELLRMQRLSTEELLAIARSQIEPEHQERHNQLLAKNEAGTLSTLEREELSALRESVDRLMLRKAYAWSILRWRGQRIPALEEMPRPR